MSCTLTSNYTLPCRDSVGGVSKLYVIELGNTTFSMTSNVATTTVNATGKKFWEYELIRETAYFTQTINDNTQNQTTYVTQELEITLPKLSTTLRDEIEKMGQVRLVFVIVDRNGKMWIMGKNNGCERNGGTASTGTAFGDLNGYKIKFMTMEANQAYEYTGLVSTLTTAGT